jgi:hypothetical protein
MSIPPQRSPTSSDMEPVDTNVDEPFQSMELAVKAADAIRKTLKQLDDPLERSLWVPPGTLPGLSAFVTTGLLLSPLRNAILTRATIARYGVTANVRTQAASPSSESCPTPPSQSFQHLMDLIITPVMAVIAAQIGLVVGTMYGSSHYLKRVVDYDNSLVTTVSNEDVDSRGKASDADDNLNDFSPCQSLLTLTDASSIKFFYNDGETQYDSIDPAPPEDEHFNAERQNSAPNLYPSWDPRQTIIESLFRAIQHCKNHRKGAS